MHAALSPRLVSGYALYHLLCSAWWPLQRGLHTAELQVGTRVGTAAASGLSPPTGLNEGQIRVAGQWGKPGWPSSMWVSRYLQL